MYVFHDPSDGKWCGIGVNSLCLWVDSPQELYVEPSRIWTTSKVADTHKRFIAHGYHCYETDSLEDLLTNYPEIFI
jgi:hypothetical protein